MEVGRRRKSPPLLFVDTPHHKRIQLLRRRLEECGADGFLTAHPANVYYLCGFTGSSGALLIGRGTARLFTDGRYAIQSRQEVRKARVQIVSGPLLAGVGLHLRRSRVSLLAFEPAQLTMSQCSELRKSAGSRIRFTRVFGLVEELRQVKSGDEITSMRKAAHLALAAFEEVLPLVQPGKREYELAAEIEYRMRQKGASGPAFDTIVASGRRSALPHARPSAKVLRKNELVVLDVGAIVEYYCSDLTRTVYLGRAPARVRRWYRSVWEAQQAARKALVPGATAGDIDAAARGVLEEAGLARWFIHSTGHGLGLEVHEDPRLARGQKKTLQAGNVVTVEPGIYLEAVGGIRIEDDFLVTPNSAVPLTKSPAELLEL